MANYFAYPTRVEYPGVVLIDLDGAVAPRSVTGMFVNGLSMLDEHHFVQFELPNGNLLLHYGYCTLEVDVVLAEAINPTIIEPVAGDIYGPFISLLFDGTDYFVTSSLTPDNYNTYIDRVYLVDPTARTMTAVYSGDDYMAWAGYDAATAATTSFAFTPFLNMGDNGAMPPGWQLYADGGTDLSFRLSYGTHISGTQLVPTPVGGDFAMVGSSPLHSAPKFYLPAAPPPPAPPSALAWTNLIGTVETQ